MSDLQLMTAEEAAAVKARLDAIEDELRQGRERMGRIEASVAENTALTREGTAVTQEVRELMELGKAGFKVLGWLGAGAKWLGVIATAGVALYSAFYAATHGGRLPHQ